jgi:twinkle protein
MTVLSLETPREPDQPLVNAELLIRQVQEIYRAGGLPRGDLTGWANVDELYTVAPAQTTVITGTPGSGKSEWLDALVVNLWRQGDWEFAIYSPENFPVATHLAKLVEKELGKPFGVGPTRRMSEAQLRMSAVALCERIFWIEPDLKTPDELIRTGLDYRTKGRKFGIILDPWNTLDHERGGLSETDYVCSVLTRVIRLARAANAHIWLVVHPAKMQRNRDGTRSVPTPYDLAGSAHWYNKADNIICVHRDQTNDSPEVEIHVQKVRFKHVGHTGLTTLHYDKVTGRYVDPGAAETYRRASNGE